MAARPSLSFPPFRLDLSGEQLWRDTQIIALRPKTFAVLRYLAERPGQLASTDELLDAVWGAQTAISDGVLKTCVRELREALGDDARTPQFVETVHRRGYRFRATVQRTPSNVGGPVASGRRSASRPVVGRETELAQLRAWFDAACRGERQIVLVSGEPGIGKTALVQAFLDQLTDQDLWMGCGQCIEQYGAGEAYLPILEALGRLCREPAGERLVTLLEQHAPTWLAQMPALLDAAALEALQRRVAGATRERMLREMGEALDALTAEQPLVLLLEDLHWSDASTLELLAMLGRRREAARLLVIGSYRPVEVIVRAHPLREVKHELELHGQCAELPLTLLTEQAVEEFVAMRFVGAGDAAPFRQLAQAIHARTEGNPLFMVNVVNDLVARDAVAEVDGQWILRGPAEDLAAAVPDSLRQMIEWQLEQLGADDRRVVEVASVAGMEFSAAAVAAGMEATLEEVEERCMTLARRGQFLRASGREEWPDGTVAARFGFQHALYEEGAYALVPAGRRAQLHQRLGERLEAAYGARDGEIAAKLAMHYERGGDSWRAVRYLRDAAQVALHRIAYQEMVAHLRKQCVLLERLPESAETLTQGLAARAGIVSLGWAVGVDAETEARIVAEARDLATRANDPRCLARILISHAAARAFHGDLDAHRACVEEAAALESQSPDRALRVNILLSFGTAHTWTGDVRELERVASEALDLLRVDARAGGDIYVVAPRTEALLHRARALHYAGRLAEAERDYELAATEAEALNAVAQTVYVASERAWLEAFRGDARAALEYASRATRLAETLGDPFTRHHAGRGNLLAQTAAGQWRDLAEGCERSMAELREAGMAGYEPWPLADLSAVYLGGGDAQRARATAEQAIAAAEGSGLRLPAIEAYMVLARALVRCEGVAARPAVERALARARTLIEETGAHSRTPCVHLAHAELACALGDKAARRRELRKAQRLFSEMGAPIRAAQVARELETPS